MGMFAEVGNLGWNALPDPNKEISFDSFVEQYKDAALNACRETGRDESCWRWMAEMWAFEDIENIKCLMALEGISAKEALLMLLRPIPAKETQEDG